MALTVPYSLGVQMSPRARLTALIEGSLAANIFDWGAAACVELYHNGAAAARLPQHYPVSFGHPRHAHSHVCCRPLLPGFASVSMLMTDEVQTRSCHRHHLGDLP